jgi:hypothetical protein
VRYGEGMGTWRPSLKLQLLWTTIPPFAGLWVVNHESGVPFEPVLHGLIVGFFAFMGIVFLACSIGTIACWIAMVRGLTCSGGRCDSGMSRLIELLPFTLLLGVEYFLPLVMFLWR